jgi:BASS family bile acid:Na+ symporter
MAATQFLPLALAFIMFGLGLTLTPADFRRIALYPKPVLIGLAVQVLFLPLLGFLLCKVFGLSPEFSIGMMILAASPGGVTANIFSHLARGDVALNISLTALNSVLAAFTLPLVVTLSLQYFTQGDEQAVTLQFRKAIEVFAVVLIPVAIGMWVKGKSESFAAKMDRPTRIFSALLLAVLAIFAIVQERAKLIDAGAVLLLACVVFNLLSIGVGFILPRVMKLSRPQSIAIAMEIGIHNSTLAIYMALSVLGTMAYAIPAALYSISMMLIGAAFVFVLNRTGSGSEISGV